MNTIQQMTTGHIIIEAIILFVVIIAALYLLYSFFYIIFLMKEADDFECELHSKVRYKQTEDLMKEINKNQNSTK